MSALLTATVAAIAGTIVILFIAHIKTMDQFGHRTDAELAALGIGDPNYTPPLEDVEYDTSLYGALQDSALVDDDGAYRVPADLFDQALARWRELHVDGLLDGRDAA